MRYAVAMALLVAGGTGIALAQSPTPSSPAYLDGQSDRRALDAWFGSQAGDVKQGAEFWAAQRSTPKPIPCSGQPQQTAEWATGCTEARKRLALPDARRHSEPDYRQGWNAPEPGAPVAQQSEPLPTPKSSTQPAPAAPTPAPTMTTSDIPRLNALFDADPDAFVKKVSGKVTFSGTGSFLQFVKVDVPMPMWMVLVTASGRTGAQIFCFYDHADANLAALQAGDPVRITGPIAMPLNNRMGLGQNCDVTPIAAPAPQAHVGTGSTVHTWALSEDDSRRVPFVGQGAALVLEPTGRYWCYWVDASARLHDATTPSDDPVTRMNVLRCLSDPRMAAQMDSERGRR
jgi:hypothetical protein